MARFAPLPEAIADLVHDGDVVAIEGFSHLVPFAAGHELLRQGQRDLTLVRMVPDLIADQLIGLGRLRRLVFSWAGNPGVGSLHRFRDAVEHGWPQRIELEEHTHAGMANRYVAGASGLPCALMRGYAGTDLAAQTTGVRFVTCPFTGESLAAVAALRPDVAIIHAQRADRAGNVQMWGIVGVQKEAVLAARRALVTVDRIVETLEPRPGEVILPAWAVTTVSEAPGGAWPTYGQDDSVRDDAFYREWDGIARDRDRFLAWMREHVGVSA
jgi:glutaconate CoA-transferase subunit A